MTVIILLILLASVVPAASALPPESAVPAAALHEAVDARGVRCDTLITWNVFRSFEMTANGAGPIQDVVGFDVSPPPLGYGAYSTDWYRDVLQGGGSVLNLPHGMQEAGGWFFVLAAPEYVLDFEYAVARWTRSGSNNSRLVGNAYEIRFSGTDNQGFAWYTTETIMAVPFQLWCIRSTLSDPADDVRMIPFLYDTNDNGRFDFASDHQADEGDDDPFCDWIYFMMPVDSSAGDAGYRAFVQEAQQGLYDGEGVEHMARVVLMNWNRHQYESQPGQGDGPIDAEPEDGTIVRIRCAPTGVALDSTIVCRTVTDINRWRVGLSADGSWAEPALEIGEGGGEWPKDSGQTFLWTAGHWLGAMKHGTASVSSVEYDSEYQRGEILNQDPAPIEDLIASDPLDPANRVYVIDSTRTGIDWEEWPRDKGAPTDANGDPYLVGDEDSWTVFNDLNVDLHGGTSDPVLGVDVRQRTFEFARGGRLEDAVFLCWWITNKSDQVYDDAYFGIWIDPDLVDPSDDLVGVDVARQMAFVYNPPYMQPVALGIDFLMGPTDTSGTPLPLASFTHYFNGIDPNNDSQRLNCLKGLTQDGQPRPGGPFDYSGNPIFGTPPLDPMPADKRMVLGTGPFRLGPGESKEIIAVLLAAEGSYDPHDALIQLLIADDEAQTFYDTHIAGSVGGLVDEDAPEILLDGVRPNPSDLESTIRFRLARDGRVDARVYDVQGRLVRTLLDGVPMAPGSRTLVWDGRNAAGRRVPSGVYLVRVDAGGAAGATRRIVRLR